MIIRLAANTRVVEPITDPRLNVDVNVRGHSISSWLRAMLARHAVIFSAGMRS
jgi:hypothetical protein